MGTTAAEAFARATLPCLAAGSIDSTDTEALSGGGIHAAA
jgi:hypothetical protein